MKKPNLFLIAFLLFFGLLNCVLTWFYPLDTRDAEYVPEISHAFFDYFVVFPISLILSALLWNTGLSKRIKTILFLGFLVVFVFTYLYFLPNRDLRLF
jgi:hypothetical protein